MRWLWRRPPVHLKLLVLREALELLVVADEFPIDTEDKVLKATKKLTLCEERILNLFKGTPFEDELAKVIDSARKEGEAEFLTLLLDPVVEGVRLYPREYRTFHVRSNVNRRVQSFVQQQLEATVAKYKAAYFG